MNLACKRPKRRKNSKSTANHNSHSSNNNSTSNTSNSNYNTNDDDNDSNSNVQTPSQRSELRHKWCDYHATRFIKNMGVTLGSIGIMDKKMETTRMGYVGFWVEALGVKGLN